MNNPEESKIRNSYEDRVIRYLIDHTELDFFSQELEILLVFVSFVLLSVECFSLRKKRGGSDLQRRCVLLTCVEIGSIRDFVSAVLINLKDTVRCFLF